MRQWLKNLFARTTLPARSRWRCRPTLERLEDRLTPTTTFTVVNLDDSGPGSLREAVQSANTTAGADTIDFQDGLTGIITLTGGQLTINGPLTIQGPGADVLAISGNQVSRIFATGGTVAISDLTLIAGKAFNQDGLLDEGGAIWNSGILTLTHCTLSGNSALSGGGILNRGTATLINCTLSGNSATTLGGGLSSKGFGTTTTLISCTLVGNSAGNGGGVYSEGTATLTNCTLSGNSATAQGGGLFNTFEATLTNCTLSDNSATTSGGGIVYSRLTLNNTIVANSPSGGEVRSFGFNPTLSGSHNLIEDGSGGLPDTLTGDPGLGPLQDNGGPTWTHALSADSPARDAGSNALAVDGTGNPLAFDQRGAARLGGDTVDIGAFEFQPIDLFAVGSGAGGGGRLKVYNADGSLRFALRVGGPGFRSSVQVATGDVNGDEIEDIVAAAGPGGPPLVWVFDGDTGQLLRRFQARPDAFKLGLNLAVADFNGDGHGDIVTAPGAGGVSLVRVFDGQTFGLLHSFRAYPPSFRGAVQVAAADLIGDDSPDLVTVAVGRGAQVFAGPGLSAPATLRLTDQRFRASAFVASGDVTGDGIADLILGDGPGGTGRVQVVSGADLSVVATHQPFGSITGQGVRVTLADVDGDGVLDVLTALGPRRRPQVRAWSLAGDELMRFDAFESGFRGGVSLG